MEDLMKHLTPELERVKSDIDGLVQKANAEIKNDLAGMRDETKTQIKNATDIFNSELKKRDEEFDKFQAAIKAAQNAAQPVKKLTAEQAILKAFGQNFDAIKGLPFANVKSLNVDVTKAAGIMTPAANWTGEVAPPDRNDEIIFDPRTDAIPASALIRNFTATSDLVKYIQETSLENYTAVVAPGGLKPRSGTKLESKEKKIIKLATEMTFAEEMLEDFAQYGPYISATLQDLLTEERNEKILYGAGGANDVEGLTVMANSLAPGAFGVNVTRFDVILQAITQVRKFRYVPTAVVMNPEDYTALVTSKDKDGQYHNGAFVFGNVAPNIAGIPIIQHNTMRPGDCLVVTQNGASLWNRMAVNVRFYDQHGDNATKNLITAVCETRLAVTPERPNAFVYFDFASALAANSGLPS